VINSRQCRSKGFTTEAVTRTQRASCFHHYGGGVWLAIKQGENNTLKWRDGYRRCALVVSTSRNQNNVDTHTTKTQRATRLLPGTHFAIAVRGCHKSVGIASGQQHCPTRRDGSLSNNNKCGLPDRVNPGEVCTATDVCG
jgi:hypothetical protein